MPALISPFDLPKYIPPLEGAGSKGLGWNGVKLSCFDHPAYEVKLPGVSDFLIVAYQAGSTLVRRRLDGGWTSATCIPGDISLLSRAMPSHWQWNSNIKVCHVYLTERLVSNVARDVMDGENTEVHLNDALKIVDPVVTACVNALALEARQNACGSFLYAESVGTQLVVHLLRRYATTSFREAFKQGGLSPAQQRLIIEYIEDRLPEHLSLATLAQVVKLGQCNFMRRFREAFNVSPHAYVVRRRIERACRLLGERGSSVKDVAFSCGFADQAHMTRAFRANLNTTPSVWQRQSIRVPSARAALNN
jgi:AraC family transcriptional regulator